jgi:plasmid stabilization system protein ParE
MIRVEVLETAALAIVEQADWYEQNSGTALADRWFTSIDESIKRVVVMPEAGSWIRIPSLRTQGLRWTTIQGFPKHLIFYRYLPEEQLLQVVHVAHGARDLDLLLAPQAQH